MAEAIPGGFRKFVDSAAAIKSSGRWAGTNKRIEALCAAPGAGNGWWVQLIASLCYKNFSEYRDLKRAFENKQDNDVSLLAWRARNLLELCVWARYCAKSRDNAWRLYEDAGRDANESYKLFIDWGKEREDIPEDWKNNALEGQGDLLQRAKEEGIGSLDQHYKRVSAAAVEADLGEHFKFDNKLLSKFAHPTAMQILGTQKPDQDALQRGVFYGLGCVFFTGAFDALEGLLKA